MPNTIRLKRRASGGATGAPASLATTEPAFNEADNVLYLGYGDSGSGQATSVVAVGGKGAFADLSSAQTIGGTKTFSATPIHPTPATADNSTNSATTAFVKAQGYITGNQTVSLSGDASGSGAVSIAVTLANSGVTAGTYTKITVDAKGRATGGTTLSAADIPALAAAKISDFDTQVRTSRLDQMAAPAAAVAFNSQRITGLADPTAAQDAATKNYVDSVAQGLNVKRSVLCATTANITLSGLQTIDGYSVAANDRVLVKNQSTAAQNGIYVAAAAAWTRVTDMDVWTEHISAFVFVEQGTTNADTGWVCTVDPGGTLGTTSITFAQFSGAGTYLAGNGLQLAGNTFSVKPNGSSIDVSASGIQISATWAGQSSITTLGAVTAGVWNATAIGVTKGGTGLTAAINGLLKGDGSNYAAAIAGTDYLSPDSIIAGGTF